MKHVDGCNMVKSTLEIRWIKFKAGNGQHGSDADGDVPLLPLSGKKAYFYTSQIIIVLPNSS